MSRIGKKIIEIPEGVSVDLIDSLVTVKSKKGQLEYKLPKGIQLTIQQNKLVLGREADTKSLKALHGLSRSILANMLQGVSNEYQKVLETFGVGYRVQLKGDKLIFALGYSHPIEYTLPKGVSATVDDKQSVITLRSIDKQLLGQTAAEIKNLRYPDSYKGKGIRYAGEKLKLKAGKAGKK
ncbi:MAG: 50S ribosomal protein L6 [Thermodesulfovibrionales bacterium]|nr:50S ribosomal protein L6 [Thermodesulfovibrionales bacterium]